MSKKCQPEMLRGLSGTSARIRENADTFRARIVLLSIRHLLLFLEGAIGLDSNYWRGILMIFSPFLPSCTPSSVSFPFLYYPQE